MQLNVVLDTVDVMCVRFNVCNSNKIKLPKVIKFPLKEALFLFFFFVVMLWRNVLLMPHVQTEQL